MTNLDSIFFFLFEFVFLLSSEKYPEVELQDHMVVLFSILWGTFILFSLAAVPIYIPTNSSQESPFLHILINICYF